MSGVEVPGFLTGLKVLELAGDRVAFAGKLLADLGAEVVVVEPPAGHVSRTYEPFLGDQSGTERSLHWWHYNTSKRGVSLDLAKQAREFRRLLEWADVVLEGEPARELRRHGVDYADVRDEFPQLIWVSVTPYGHDVDATGEATTDLTLSAEGGIVWSCGYDDHSLPPVRPGENHSYQTASIWAVMATLTAVLHRDATGQGQLCDVSVYAAVNVTTEAATYEWLVAGATVQRQTARHAAVTKTMSTMVRSIDGRPIVTGVPPRTADGIKSLVDWLNELGLRGDFDDVALLELGAGGVAADFSLVGDDALATAIIGAGRDAMNLIASRLTAYDYFVGGQRHGIACGVIYSPDEVIEDPHLLARGFPVRLGEGESPDRAGIYPGAPFICEQAPWQIYRAAPRIGEHNDIYLSQD